MFPVHVLPLATGGGGWLQTLQAGLRLQRPGDCRQCRGGLGLLETLGQEECTHWHLSGEEVSITTSLSIIQSGLCGYIGCFAPPVVQLQQCAKFHVFVKLRNNCRETVPCYYHSDCEDDLRCVVGHCGDPEYFRALAEMPCSEVR